MTRVLHIKDPEAKDGIYIGRGSPWGNPFIIGKDGTREEVIAKYKDYFYNVLLKDRELENSVWRLQDKNLVCYCSPLPCHGDIIVDYFDKYEEFKRELQKDW